MAFGRIFKPQSSNKPLHLRAETAEDVSVLSAFLQDAVMRRADMGFRPKERRFALLANRYRWERNQGERIRCGVHFDSVSNVAAQGFELIKPTDILSLLAVTQDQAPMEQIHLTLIFAGGPLLRLTSECIDITLDDIGEGWITPRHPDHDNASDSFGENQQ